MVNFGITEVGNSFQNTFSMMDGMQSFTKIAKSFSFCPFYFVFKGEGIKLKMFLMWYEGYNMVNKHYLIPTTTLKSSSSDLLMYCWKSKLA